MSASRVHDPLEAPTSMTVLTSVEAAHFSRVVAITVVNAGCARRTSIPIERKADLINLFIELNTDDLARDRYAAGLFASDSS